MPNTTCRHMRSLRHLRSIATFFRFTAAIDAVNGMLEQYADGRKQVTYLDCSQGFVEDHPKVGILSVGPQLMYLHAMRLCHTVIGEGKGAGPGLQALEAVFLHVCMHTWSRHVAVRLD